MRISATGVAFGGDGRGHARWRGLADRALAEVGYTAADTLVIGSCNGGVDVLSDAEWSGAFALGGPVASASCASGLQALWWAAKLARSTVVLACDIASPASAANFEVLRVLAPSPQAPWRGDSAGFVPGEAAVALRVEEAPAVRLGVELGLGVGLADAVDDVAPGDLVIGQGTGPGLVDDQELEVIARFAGAAPLATAGFHHGHTLGASGLLGLALALRGGATGLAGTAKDGRALAASIAPGSRATIVCRALGGAWAIASTHAKLPAKAPRLLGPRTQPPFMTPAMRAIVETAQAHTPTKPPGAVVVVLEHPLTPPGRARRGERLLPSAVLEITPGAAAVAVARAWGYTGPSLAIVSTPDDAAPWLAAVPDACVLYVRGDGDERTFVWQHARG